MKSHCCSASASATECEALRALHSRIPTQTGILQPVSQHLSGHWIQAFVRNNQTRKKKALKASDLNLWFNLLWQLCTHQWQCLALSPFLDPLLSPPLSLSLTFLFLFCLFFCFCPSHSLLRSTPLLAPEQNEPPLHSGTLFLWQCEQASKSAGYCSANV